MYEWPQETYTTDWNKLVCDDLHNRDKHFAYSIEEATSTSFKIKVTSKRGPSHYCIIDEDGKIVDEKGRTYVFTAE